MRETKVPSQDFQVEIRNRQSILQMKKSCIEKYETRHYRFWVQDILATVLHEEFQFCGWDIWGEGHGRGGSKYLTCQRLLIMRTCNSGGGDEMSFHVRDVVHFEKIVRT